MLIWTTDNLYWVTIIYSYFSKLYRRFVLK